MFRCLTASPSPTSLESRVAGSETANPHSQWRDRAGFSPDFPVMPSKSAPERDFQYARSNPAIARKAPRRPVVSTSDRGSWEVALFAGGRIGRISQPDLGHEPPVGPDRTNQPALNRPGGRGFAPAGVRSRDHGVLLPTDAPAFASRTSGNEESARLRARASSCGPESSSSGRRFERRTIRNGEYRGILKPTIESMVLTTLNRTSPGRPPSAYQNMGLRKPSVRLSLKLSIAARRQAAASSFDVSRPTSLAMARRAAGRIPALGSFFHVPSVAQEIAQREQAVDQEDVNGRRSHAVQAREKRPGAAYPQGRQ